MLIWRQSFVLYVTSCHLDVMVQPFHCKIARVSALPLWWCWGSQQVDDTWYGFWCVALQGIAWLVPNHVAMIHPRTTSFELQCQSQVLNLKQVKGETATHASCLAQTWIYNWKSQTAKLHHLHYLYQPQIQTKTYRTLRTSTTVTFWSLLTKYNSVQHRA